ncbi:unannotated protein [freshwater metagenome]|uniref:Unannotated protein n=1 Tax=freshwater metagenome TaxID=449393 RepID=A0A6J7J7Q9_9ZZZZ
MAIRIGIGALLLAALVAVFSLRALPRPLTADLPAEAYDAAQAMRLNSDLTAQFPSRRAGSPGDAALADRVAVELRRALPSAAIDVDEFTADTPDGTRTLRNVSATLPGLPGPEILIVAHRDALRRGSPAEMTGTSGLIALARAAGQNRFRRTVQFVSTTGGSGGGLSGATRLARAAKGRVATAIVLGDLSGDPARRPTVLAWGNTPSAAPLRLERTVEAALRGEGLRTAPSESLWRQIVRRGLPATVGEQGEFDQAGVPSVLMTTTDGISSAGTGTVDARRFGLTGRAALRALLAVDLPSADVGAQQSGIVLAGRELPGWALRVLLLCLVLPLAGGALVLSIALARDGVHLLGGLAWTAGCAVGPLVAGLVAIGAGRTGLAWPALPAPFAGTAVETGAGAWVLIAVLTLVLLVFTALARPFLVREIAGHHRPTRPAVAFGVFAVLLVTMVPLLVLDPLAAYLLVPALAAWPAAISPVPVVAPLHRAGLFLVGALLPLAAVVTVLSDLRVGVLEVPWWLVLLVAGGHVTPVAMLLLSLVAGAAIATLLSVVPPVGNPVTGRRGTAPDPGPGRPRRARGPRPAAPGSGRADGPRLLDDDPRGERERDRDAAPGDLGPDGDPPRRRRRPRPDDAPAEPRRRRRERPDDAPLDPPASRRPSPPRRPAGAAGPSRTTVPRRRRDADGRGPPRPDGRGRAPGPPRAPTRRLPAPRGLPGPDSAPPRTPRTPAGGSVPPGPAGSVRPVLEARELDRAAVAQEPRARGLVADRGAHLADPRHAGQGVGDRGRRGEQQLVVLPRGGGQLDGVAAGGPGDRVHAGLPRQGRQVDVQHDPGGPPDVPGVGGRAVGEVDAAAHPGRHGRDALGQPREGPQVPLDERLPVLALLRRVPEHDRQAGTAAAEAPGDADAVAGPGAVAAQEPVGPVRPADDGHGDHEGRPGGHVAARDRRAGAAREVLDPRDGLEDVGVAPRRGDGQRDVRLAGGDAHRREVREGGGQRAVPDDRGRRPRVALGQMHAQDRRVGARDGQRTGGPNDRGVVAGADQEAVVAGPQARGERPDECALAHGGSMTRTGSGGGVAGPGTGRRAARVRPTGGGRRCARG